MEILRVTAGPFLFLARKEVRAAPRTCAAFDKLLPFRRQLIHARWSGEACWIPLGDFQLGVDPENSTGHPAAGQLLFHPGGPSETEILLPYGVARFASQTGPLTGNHFLTIVGEPSNCRTSAASCCGRERRTFSSSKTRADPPAPHEPLPPGGRAVRPASGRWRPPVVRVVAVFDLDAYVARSGSLDLSALDWAAVARHPLPAEAGRALRYMQDIESHTIVYLRLLLATRAIDDPEVATFLACWLYEETFHGMALARFLAAAGHPVGPRPRPRGQEPLAKRLEAMGTAALSRLWPDFCAVHMTWGAINELTTLTGYRRLATLAGHPVLSDLLERIVLDESRHFFFYYRQASIRLRRPGVARVARLLVDRFWAPVGSGVQPREELCFLAGYLFNGGEGRAAARRVDETIRRLPGFETVGLLEAWMDRSGEHNSGVKGGRHGNGNR